MRSRRWSDMSPGARRAVVALAVAQVSLAAAAWADLARRPPAGVNGKKQWWALAILVNFAGPLAYFRWGRRRPPPGWKSGPPPEWTARRHTTPSPDR